MRLCRLRDCEEIHHAKGYCRRHYDKWRRHGRPDPELWDGQSRLPGPKAQRTGCRFCGPNVRHKAFGLCTKCYHQWLRDGRPDLNDWQPGPRKKGPKPKRSGCLISGCENKHYAFGLCRLDYRAWVRAGRPDLGSWILKPRKVLLKNRRPRNRDLQLTVMEQNQAPECIVHDCHEDEYRFGFCLLHFIIWDAYGQPDPDTWLFAS